MAVTKPTNDETLTKDAIKSMHDDVRDVVNDVKEVNLGRNGLNYNQLPGVICAYDFKSQTTQPIHLTYSDGRFQQETPGSIIADWYCYHKATADNANWVLSNSGAGYTLPPCKVIAFINLRISRVVESGKDPTSTTASTAIPHSEYSNSWMLFAGLGYEDSTGEHFNLSDTGCVRALDTNTYHGTGAANHNKAIQFTTGYDHMPQVVEQSISIWKVIDKSSEAGDWVLTSIHPRFATFEGNTSHKNPDGNPATPPMISTGLPPTWRIGSASFGFFALRS